MLVGNGFDLAHDLPTGYRDFTKFLKAVKYADEFDLNSSEYAAYLDKMAVHSDIKEFLSTNTDFNKRCLAEVHDLILHNIWGDLFTGINTESLKTGWIDFEKQISSVIKKLDKLFHLRGVSSRDGPSFSDALHQLQFLEDCCNQENMPNALYGDQAELIKRLEQDLNKLIRCLEIYMCICLEALPKKQPLSIMSQIGKVDAVLSFNYTDTYDRLYRHNYPIQPEYCYIHGNAKIENTIELDKH